jgi:hypothetical protein
MSQISQHEEEIKYAVTNMQSGWKQWDHFLNSVDSWRMKWTQKIIHLAQLTSSALHNKKRVAVVLMQLEGHPCIAY